jgi:hypothetical protein
MKYKATSLDIPLFCIPRFLFILVITTS